MLKNFSIKLKILTAILMLSVMSLGGVAYLGMAFIAADDAYNEFMAHESDASMLTARSSGAIIKVALEANRTTNMEVGSDAYKAIVKAHDSTLERARERTIKSGELVPSRATQVAAMLKEIDELEALDRKVFAFMDAGDIDSARLALRDVDAKLDTLLPAVTKANDELAQLVTDGRAVLSADIRSTVVTGLIGIVIVVLLSIAFAMYIAQTGITGPMAQLRARMASLATGDTEAEIVGLDRKDEIGAMAATVAVFRSNALDRTRLARQNEADRSMSDRERAEREAQKVAEAADLKRAVDALGVGLRRLADGDVAFQIETPFVPHLDALRQDFNNSVEKLDHALNAVGANARAISGGANEIRGSADNLSKRTEQQAASVEETAAALEQITTTVKDAARRAKEASHLVAQTRTGAEKSGQIVRDAVKAMHQIEQSSSEISNIIGVIDDIAFQTNLLALNAGVEAARAGEAGKGFAVVAQEVRELAQRSANAAKEIKALITTSGAQVATGVNLVGETGKALDAIVSEVKEIDHHVHAIAETAREQSVGLQEINTAVNTMDQGTQQNAAMVEETTAASHTLATEAASLTELLSQFRLTGTRGGGYASAPVSRSQPTQPAPVRRAAPAPVRAVTDTTRPAPSPARRLGQTLANAFGGSSNTATSKPDADWTEF